MDEPVVYAPGTGRISWLPMNNQITTPRHISRRPSSLIRFIRHWTQISPHGVLMVRIPSVLIQPAIAHGYDILG